MEVEVAVVDGHDHAAAAVPGQRLVEGEDVFALGQERELLLEQPGRQVDLATTPADPVVQQDNDVAGAGAG